MKKKEKNPQVDSEKRDPMEATQATEPPSDESAAADTETPVCDAQAEQAPDSNNTDAMEQELAEMKDRYLRLMAEYDNYRKRTAKEKESFFAMAKADTIEKILPVFDNLERAVNNPTQDEAYKKGIEMILQQLKDAMAQLGVTEIDAEGMQFDPAKHNAVMHIEDAQYGENSIVEVFQRGFELDGRVIRYAVVKVAN